jgi:hypothetical protein
LETTVKESNSIAYDDDMDDIIIFFLLTLDSSEKTILECTLHPDPLEALQGDMLHPLF